VDEYLMGIEVEVDAVTDGETVVVPGIVRHVEPAGVHSGDSCAVYPAPGLDARLRSQIVQHTIRMARHLGLRGLVNVQFVLHGGGVHVLELNPRASRTVPMLSKVTGVPMVALAMRVMLGERLADLGWPSGLVPPRPLFAVKAPVFSWGKLAGLDVGLGPEMRSTGEVLGVDRTLAGAMRKAFQAAGVRLRPGGAALLALDGAAEADVLPLVLGLRRIGHRVHATPCTAAVLARAGCAVEAGLDPAGVIRCGLADVLVDTTAGPDGFRRRRLAAERGLPCLTSLDTAIALLDSAATENDRLVVRTITEYRAPETTDASQRELRSSGLSLTAR
jgi:carbamoyl-phosphate synthase large subunit